MKTLSTIIFTLLVSFFAFATADAQETCDCSKDLVFMNDQIREMTSFKKQIKGEKLEAFNDTYEALQRKATSETPVLDCYQLLNTLLVQVKDKHAHIKHNVQKEVSVAEGVSGEAHFRASEAFQKHPTTAQDIKELSLQLENEPLESFEGVYHYGDDMKVGIVSNGEGYDVIVIESNNKQWVPGQLQAQITIAEKDLYNVLVYNTPGGKMTYVRSLYFFDNTLWNYRKNKQRSLALTPNATSDWDFKQLDKDTQYVYFGSWSNNAENVAAFETFYNEHKDQFTAKNIIVDVRNNSGGNSKYSDPFFKIFKKKKMNIYVLTNFWSGSNSEQFTLKLRSLKNTTHLGQRTYGALAYGSNYGKYIESPSGLFSIYPTDMNFHKFINYEYTGVQPEIALTYKKDWVAQTLALIATKK